MAKKIHDLKLPSITSLSTTAIYRKILWQPLPRRRSTLSTLVLSFALSSSLVLTMTSNPSGADGPTTFSNPNIMVSVGGENARKADLAVDHYGRLYAAWIDWRDGYSDIFFSMSIDGGYTWSENVMVNTAPQASWGYEDQYNPTIAANGKNVYVAWMDCRNAVDATGGCGGPYDLYMDWSPVDNIDFTAEDTLITYDDAIPADSSTMAMAADEKNVYLIWPGFKDGRCDIFLDYSSSDNVSFSRPHIRVTSDDPDFQQDLPEITSDGNSVYVAWRDFRDREPGTVRSDIYFDWSPIADMDFSSADIRLGSDLTGMPWARRKSPNLATDENNVYVAWSDNRVWGADSDSWLTWSSIDNISFTNPDIRVNNYDGNGQGHPSIASDGVTLYAAWQDNRNLVDVSSDVYFNMAPVSDLNFSQPDIKVNDYSEPHNQDRPTLCIYDDGEKTHVFVIWEDDRYGAPSGKAIMFASSPPQPLYPDLSVNDSDIAVVPAQPALNMNIALNSTIHNIGEMGVPNATVTFYDGDPSLNQTIGESTISVLAHNETHATTNWTPLLPGDYEIYVVVDPDDMVNESSETNNVAKVRISVVPHRPPTVLQATLSGKDLENVTVILSLSPDDGMGSKSVIGYEIYRNLTYDPGGSGYSLIASLPNGTSNFIDGFAGEGDPNDYFYRVCSIDLNGHASCAKDQAGKFTRPLIKGPNLVSVPLIQSDESVDAVLQTVEFDKAWIYDSSSEKWKWHMTFKPYKGELKSISETQGFWVNVTEDCNFTVAGIVPFETAIRLDRGWNLVSFPTFTEGYTVSDFGREVNATVRVEGFSSSSEPYRLMVMQETEALEAGYGYWIKVAVSTTWFVSN